MGIRIELPYLPPASFSPNSRVHWSARNRDNKMVRSDVIHLLRAMYSHIPSFTAIALKYTVVVPDKRRRDYENFVARCKPITDALVAAGVVPDDCPEYIKEYRLDFQHEPGQKETIIEVKEL